MIDRLSQFLTGHSEEVTQNIHSKLNQAAENLEFERAAVFRDQLTAISRITEHQKVVSPQMVDQDVIAFARRNQVKAIYFFNLKTRTDTPNENGRISTGLFNAAGCPRLEYKQLLQILGRPAQFGPCKDPGNADF